MSSPTAREPVGLDETVLDAMNRDARTAVSISFLVERVDTERDAMREERAAAGLVEGRQPVPEPGLILRRIGLPSLVPVGNRLGGRTVLQFCWLHGEKIRAARTPPDKTSFLGSIEGALVLEERWKG